MELEVVVLVRLALEVGLAQRLFIMLLDCRLHKLVLTQLEPEVWAVLAMALMDKTAL